MEESKKEKRLKLQYDFDKTVLFFLLGVSIPFFVATMLYDKKIPWIKDLVLSLLIVILICSILIFKFRFLNSAKRLYCLYK